MDREKVARELLRLAKDLTAGRNILDKKYPRYRSLSDAASSDDYAEIRKLLDDVGLGSDTGLFGAIILTRGATLREVIEHEYEGYGDDYVEELLNKIKRSRYAKNLTASDKFEVLFMTKDGDTEREWTYARNEREAVKEVRDGNWTFGELIDVRKIKASKSRVAGHYQDGRKWYADTAFINAVQYVYPNSTLEHLGFGEFYLSTPDGNLEFDRMRGKNFEGQSGRSHLLYDNAGGKVVKKAIKLMERSGKSKQASTTSNKVIRDIYNLSSGTMATLTGLKNYSDLDRIQREFGEFAEDSPKNYKTWSDAWDDFAKEKRIMAKRMPKKRTKKRKPQKGKSKAQDKKYYRQNKQQIKKQQKKYRKTTKRRSSEIQAFDKWKKMPKGWTDESRKKYWNSLVGNVKHKVTKCIKEMEGKIGDPGAFCASLADRVEGKGWRSER
jgi:hypothetical protein